MDEFQDTNPIQMEILTLLLPSDNGNDSSFWICGDDAQSHIRIHGGICRQHSQFQIDVPRIRADHLNLNYRSTPQILRACQNLIRHNEKQIQKALETKNPSGDDVIVLESSSEETEALTVVNEIREMVEKGNTITGTLLFYTGQTFRAVILKRPSSSTRSPITSQTASVSMIERRSRFCWIISGSFQIQTAMTETMPWSIS